MFVIRLSEISVIIYAGNYFLSTVETRTFNRVDSEAMISILLFLKIFEKVKWVRVI